MEGSKRKGDTSLRALVSLELEAAMAREGILKLCKDDVPVFRSISRPDDDAY